MRQIYTFNFRRTRLNNFPLLLIASLFFCFHSYGQRIYTVNTVNDNPDVDLTDDICADVNLECSLRAAIENANKTSETDRVEFHINGNGVMKLSLKEDLPAITETVILDATTQPGYTWKNPMIVLTGNENVHYGLMLKEQSSGSSIRGLVLGGFSRTNKEEPLLHGAAIFASATGNHDIRGNFIGIAEDGETSFPNTVGISLVNSSSNSIGGNDPSDANVLSGNSIDSIHGYGLFLRGEGSHGNKILGNYVGTNAAGTVAVANLCGIVIYEGANNNYIGSGAVNGRNIISGNLQSGIYILSPANVVRGNFIGPAVHGSNLLNSNEKKQEGVRLWTGTATGNIIGGLEPGEGNLISGNDRYNGITMGSLDIPISNNSILGNYIGTNEEGTIPLPNYRGVTLGNATSTIIRGNLISGNQTFGLSIHNSHDIVVYENIIGAQIDKRSPMGNGEEGIAIINGSKDNKIGGLSPGEANTIAYNKVAGVAIKIRYDINSPVLTNPLNNIVLGNRIFSNNNSGIDLGDRGILQNDRNDSDAGPNNLQNFPELAEGAALEASVLNIAYLLPADPAYSAFPIRIHFYKSDGTRQGAEYLGSDTYTVDDIPKGKNTKTASIALLQDHSLQPGDRIVATATDAHGNTSEFSAEVTVTGNCEMAIWYADADGDGFGIDAAESNIESCTTPEGAYVSRSGDCDDTDAAIHPDAEDVPDDGIDQNCDGQDETLHITDSDGDGIEDALDNCPEIANVDQTDSDNDGIGDACEIISECSGSVNLLLTETCTTDPTNYRSWIITNPGNCPVDVRWEVHKTNQSGTTVAQPGETLIENLQVASKGSTQLIIYWSDENGSYKLSSNSSGISCTTTSAQFIEAEELQIVATDLEVYPNPISEEGIWLYFPYREYSSVYSAYLFDINGRLLESKIFEVPVGGEKFLWQINQSRILQGIYILKVTNPYENFEVKLMKE